MASYSLRIISVKFIVLLSYVLIGFGESKICPKPSFSKDTDEKRSPVHLQTQEPILDCPRPSDPLSYSECCSNSIGHQCCPPERHFYEIDNRLATTIAVSVTLSGVIITTIIIICCFWSKCPLYSTCRVHYSPQDEIVYAKEDEALDMKVMPSDTDNTKSFSCRKPSITKGSAV